MLSCPHVNGPYNSAPADISKWKPGEWHHIAGTWSERRQAVYVDGKLVGTAKPNLPTSLEPTFRLGDNPWHIARTSSSLVDRVRIYDQMLSADQIAAHYAGNYDAASPLSEKSLDFSYTLNVDRKELHATAELIGSPDVDEGQLAATFSLVPKGQAEKPGNAVPFTNGAAEMTAPVGDLPPGSYVVSATVTAPGHDAIHFSKPLDIPKTDWMGNRIGMEDKVLPPWTPLVVGRGENPTVECWGRQYAFERSPLPSQIISAGKPMLARPMQVVVTVAGKRLEWSGGRARVESATPTKAQLTGMARADVAGGVAELQTSVRAEYDGLLVVGVGLSLPAGVKPDAVALEIPLRGDVVYYRHRWSPNWAGYTGNLTAGQGVVDSDGFIPYAWLGDNDRGLFWFCESGEHWPNFEGKNAFETARTGGEVTMRLNLVAAGQDIPEGWRYEFGLQATPVKPIPRDWRKWRLLPAPRANVGIFWPTPNPDSQTYFGYPEASDPAVFEKRVGEHHEKGIKVVPYSCLTFLSGASGEFQWFGQKWSMGGGDATSSDVAAYGAVFEMVSPTSPGLADFLVAKNKEFMDRYGLDGYYHDNTHPYACARPEANCGWTRGGRAYPTHPILAYRELYRRIYAMVKSHDRPTFMMAHMSGKVTIPILAYEDSYLDGENFRLQVKDHYPDVLPLDTFRAEFMGRQWGIMPYFLPEFSPPYDTQVEPTRGLAGMLMVHDVAPWAIWCNGKVFEEALDALDAFGYVDASFVPYFDPKPPATTDMRDVLASAYTQPGRALVIVANLSREDRSGTVRLDFARMGLKPGAVVSWPDRADLKRDGNAVRLDVPGRGYRMLFLGTEPKKTP
jgi:hypothetical protein